MAEKQYIERDEVLQKISRMIEYCKKDNKVNGLTALFQAADAVIDCKSADVQEVTRCKDCKYRHSSEFCECREPDAYCSDGERMDGD